MKNMTMHYCNFSKFFLQGIFILLSVIGCDKPLIHAQANNEQYPAKLVVSADGTGDCKTINEALSMFRAYSPVPLTLVLKPGIYKEKVIVPAWVCNLTIEGASAENTIITYDDYSGKSLPGGLDTVTKRDKYSTFNSYTLLIRGNDIELRNLTVQNTSGRVGQAVALHIEGDRVSVVHCRLIGNQDTLLTANDSSRQYFYECFIEGTTDFIFGPATAVFERCHIHSLANSYITAASTPQWKQFGYVFFDCKLTASNEVTKVYLGRPWRPYAKVVFLNTEMGKHIIPEGWHNWGKKENELTAYYAEYKSYGNGGLNLTERVPWSYQLKKKETALYKLKNIFGTWQPKV